MTSVLIFTLCSALLLLPYSLAHGIAAVLSSTSDLSTLNAIVSQYPALLDSLASASGTFLAPSNDALEQFVAALGDASTITEEAISDLLSYHLLPLAYSSANLSGAGGRIAETQLLDSAFANLEGAPNVVFASAFGSTGQESAPSGLKIYSGVGTASNVTRADLAFEGGVVHVIDRVLNFPRTCTQTAEAASLSTLLEAIQTTNLTEVVDTTAKFTCFAPTNEAFEAAGINLTALTTEQIVDALKYHSIVGDVGYSTAFEDGREYQTLAGIPVTVHKRDGQLFINNAAVQVGNVIMSNGVAHVLNAVLIPPSDSTSSGTPSSGGSSTGTATVPGGTAAAASASSGSSTSSAASYGVPLKFAALISSISAMFTYFSF